jgi:hypothetical protein
MYSPQKSAEIAGVSRKTVMDAINAQKLKSKRNNRNYWVISEVDLKAWMDSRRVKLKPDTSSDAFSDTSSKTITQLTVENKILAFQLKVNAEVITDLKQRLLKADTTLKETTADLEIQRESWKAQAQQLLKYMDSIRVEDKPPPLILGSTDRYNAQKSQTDTPEPQNAPIRKRRKKIFGIF